MSLTPRQFIERFEAAPTLPTGLDERFSGYGVMGLPFASGHVLAMRRFAMTSVGPGYTSIWHRSPRGQWMFYSTVSPRQGCPRYFGDIAADSIETEIRIRWTAPFRLTVVAPAVPLEWDIGVAATLATRLMNATGRLLPDAAWRNPGVLAAMAKMAGPLLGVGRIGLQGHVPNGQGFVANPRVVWSVTDSRAVLAGADLGPPGPVQPQAHLGDFWIPQRGMLAIGAAYFEAFDPVRHSSRTFQSQALDDAAADRDPSSVRPGAPAGPREGLSPPRRT